MNTKMFQLVIDENRIVVNQKMTLIETFCEGDIPLFGTQYSGFFRRYAVRKGLVRSTHNSVISYSDINFYFENVQFSSRNTTHVTYKVK